MRSGDRAARVLGGEPVLGPLHREWSRRRSSAGSRAWSGSWPPRSTCASRPRGPPRASPGPRRPFPRPSRRRRSSRRRAARCPRASPGRCRVRQGALARRGRHRPPAARGARLRVAPSPRASRARPPGAAAAATRAGSGAGASPGFSPGARNSAITVPTGIVVPGSTSSRSTVPSCQVSTSTAAFVVSTTATTSPFFTASPGFTFHSRSLPSSMSAPRDGSLNSIIGTGPSPRPRSCRVAGARPPRGASRRGSALPRGRRARPARRGRRTPAP